MDLRAVMEVKSNSAPARIQNYMPQENAGSPTQDDKKKETPNQKYQAWYDRFFPIARAAKQDTDLVLKDVKAFAEGCLKKAKNNDIKNALNDLDHLKDRIEGKFTTIYNPRIRKHPKLLKQLPSELIQIKCRIASLHVDHEYLELIDSVRRELAGHIFRVNHQRFIRDDIHQPLNPDELEQAKHIIRSLIQIELKDLQLMQSIYTLLASYFKTVQKPEDSKHNATQRENLTPLIAKHYQNTRLLMFKLIDGGTLPDEAREKFINLPLSVKK